MSNNLVNTNAYAKFGNFSSIYSEDIDLKRNSYITPFCKYDE